jgi:hypothetical protein
MSETSEARAADDRGHFAEADCLNCGTALVGSHCHQCGQAAHLHCTLGGFLHDLAHGVLHLDGKAWRTLPMLAFRPGRLTRDYIDGHRARYVSPMALFLFSVFMIFAVSSLLGVSTPGTLAPIATAEEQADVQIGKMEGNRDRRAGEPEKVEPGAPERAAQEERVAEVEADIASTRDFQTGLVEGFDDLPEFTLDRQGATSPFLAGLVAKWRENPGLMLYKMQANSYKFSWLLIPISVPLVALLFLWRRRFGLYDHSIFVTYSIAFMSLFFIALAIAGSLGAPGWLVSSLGGTIPIMHLYAHVRGTYGLSHFSAVWRSVALLVFILLALIFFVIALALIGAF